MSDFGYKPSEWGARYHALTTHEALGAGAAGPGKSLVLLMDPLEQIIVEHNRTLLPRDHEHYLGRGASVGWALHLRRTRPMLEQTIARAHRIFPLIDPGVHWDSQRSWFVFTSGYHYQFGHCANPDDWEIYMSNEYTHQGWDELTQFEREQYEQVKTRVRCTDPVLKNMLKVRSMSNPMMRRTTTENVSVKDPHWVRKYFVDPNPKGNTILKKKITRPDGSTTFRTRIYLPAKLSDNPDKVFVKQYEETLLDAKPHIRKALLDGDWYVTAGSYYGDEWDQNKHICDPFNIPSHWARFRSMDWGFKKPGCIHWYAIDEDGNLFVERELTFVGKTAKEVALRVKEIEKDAGLWKNGRSTITGPADNQLWEQRGETGRSKAEEFSAVGISWTKADKRSRVRNAERLSGRLKDHSNGKTTPGIVFFSTCKRAIQTIPAIGTDPDDIEVPQDGGEDHWHDSVLYGCAYASRDRTPGNDNDGKKRRDSDDGVTHGRGRWGYGSEVA